MLDKIKKIIIDKYDQHYNFNEDYLFDEIQTYPDKEDVIRFAFTQFPVAEDIGDAWDLAFLQAAYLLDKSSLEGIGYLKLLHLLDGYKSFFYLSPDKCLKVLGSETSEALHDFHINSDFYFDNGRLHLNDDFQDYQTDVSEYINKYGFAALCYTFQDILDAEEEISTSLPIYLNEEIERTIWSYASTLLSLEESTLEGGQHAYTLICLELQKRLLEVDSSQSIKVHLMKNLRLCDGRQYIGVDEELRKKRSQLKKEYGLLFKNYKK